MSPCATHAACQLLRFDKISVDIRAKADEWESKAHAMVADVEARALKLSVAAATKLLETSQNTHANALVADWCRPSAALRACARCGCSVGVV